jgi:Flp pilus assembly protein TadB
VKAVLVCLLAVIVLIAVVGHDRPVQRLGGVRPARSEDAARTRSIVESGGRRLLVCLAAGTLVGWAVLGVFGLPFGAVGGVVASWWAGRLESPTQTRRREAAQRELPLAVDLLAACSEVGLPLDRALVVVAASLPGPVGDELGRVAARLALGMDPVAEWHRVAQNSALAPLARTVLRSLESGAPLATGLARLAHDRRRDLRTRGQVRARQVGVQAAGPLGVCFLPAFMLIGVVPTVVGTFTDLILQ